MRTQPHQRLGGIDVQLGHHHAGFLADFRAGQRGELGRSVYSGWLSGHVS
jgi:hypothetical protein